MAGSHNKKQKRIRQEDKIGVDDMDQTLTVDPSTVEEEESVENKKEQTGDPPSPTSSDNSTSTNQSGPHDVLLRVSEAHLALLGDEDGDTPLHLAIIHERVDLVKEMLRTITNVNMPLDCANRMRQVRALPFLLTISLASENVRTYLRLYNYINICGSQCTQSPLSDLGILEPQIL